MPYRRMSITIIVFLFLITIVFIFSYGPAKRVYLPQDKTVSLKLAGEIIDLWHSSGVHGRVAVLFTRYPSNEFSRMEFPEIDFLDIALREGILRRVYYVFPDRFQSAVEMEMKLSNSFVIEPVKTDTGFMILHEGGRIHVMPLSKYIPAQEKALVVIEPAAWPPQELSRIDGFIKSGQLPSDLTVIIEKGKLP